MDLVTFVQVRLIVTFGQPYAQSPEQAIANFLIVGQKTTKHQAQGHC